VPKLASRTAAFLAAVSALVSREYCPGRCAGTELQQHAAHERRCVGGGTQELPERGYRSASSNSEVKRARALAEDGAQPLAGKKSARYFRYDRQLFSVVKDACRTERAFKCALGDSTLAPAIQRRNREGSASAAVFQHRQQPWQMTWFYPSRPW
jgi:hypothetical protein